jgi:hypothetical protein
MKFIQGLILGRALWFAFLSCLPLQFTFAKHTEKMFRLPKNRMAGVQE